MEGDLERDRGDTRAQASLGLLWYVDAIRFPTSVH